MDRDERADPRAEERRHGAVEGDLVADPFDEEPRRAGGEQRERERQEGGEPVQPARALGHLGFARGVMRVHRRERGRGEDAADAAAATAAARRGRDRRARALRVELRDEALHGAAAHGSASTPAPGAARAPADRAQRQAIEAARLRGEGREVVGDGPVDERAVLAAQDALDGQRDDAGGEHAVVGHPGPRRRLEVPPRVRHAAGETRQARRLPREDERTERQRVVEGEVEEQVRDRERGIVVVADVRELPVGPHEQQEIGVGAEGDARRQRGGDRVLEPLVARTDEAHAERELRARLDAVAHDARALELLEDGGGLGRQELRPQDLGAPQREQLGRRLVADVVEREELVGARVDEEHPGFMDEGPVRVRGVAHRALHTGAGRGGYRKPTNVHAGVSCRRACPTP